MGDASTPWCGSSRKVPASPTLYCAPGNAGIESLATCVPLNADDIAGLKTFVQSEKIDLTVVGPEAPLALGIVDEFRKSNLKIFGPTKGAARIEASKVFSKEIMRNAKILTARAQSFDQVASALAYLDQHELPVVVKADGLAQGKGVVVATTRDEATTGRPRFDGASGVRSGRPACADRTVS